MGFRLTDLDSAGHGFVAFRLTSRARSARPFEDRNCRLGGGLVKRLVNRVRRNPPSRRCAAARSADVDRHADASLNSRGFTHS